MCSTCFAEVMHLVCSWQLQTVREKRISLSINYETLGKELVIARAESTHSKCIKPER